MFERLTEYLWRLFVACFLSQSQISNLLSQLQPRVRKIIWRITIMRLACRYLIPIVLLLSVTFIDVTLAETDLSQSEIASQIKDHFDCKLFALSPPVQRHYATRMYRMTGDSRYIPSTLADLRLLRLLLQRDVGHLGDQEYVAGRVEELLNEFNDDTRKGRLRKEALAQRGHLIFDLDLLYRCDQVRQYGLESSEAGAWSRKALVYLRNTDLATRVLDPELVKVYSAQLANVVYYLRSCLDVDIRNEFITVFEETFPDEADDDLSMAEFEDKIYGLTHIIIAASDYYQHEVDPDEFAWILQYFRENAEAILLDTKPDVVAEVGICFLLAGKPDERIVARCREMIQEAYDHEARMIPSESGSTDLELGEHRNILAYLLLTLPRDLQQGPTLESLLKLDY